MATKVLFIGGTGCISASCAALAVEQGIELYLLTRGKASDRPAPEGARLLHGDIREPDSVRAVIGDLRFDCVVEWMAFTPEHIETDLELFRGRTSQYVFISTAMVYRKPPGLLPITESTFTWNPYSSYARNKILCEERLVAEFRANGFPSTIVRPSHTYDRAAMPLLGGWTIVDRMMRGLPVPVHGDGSSLWALTHSADFARGFNGLLGNHNAVGEAFHITSDEALSWNTIFGIFADILGVEADLVHVPTDTLIKHAPEWEESVLGDRANSAVFDNAKIRRYSPGFAPSTPFTRGAREIVEWHMADAARRQVDPEMDALLGRIVDAQRRAFPGS